MMQYKETRREFLQKAVAFAFAVPLLSNCATAQKHSVSDLELIKKNADKSGAN